MRLEAGPGRGNRPVALVLTIASVAHLLSESVSGVHHGPHQLRVGAQVERASQEDIPRRIEEPLQGLIVAQLGPSKPEDLSNALSNDLLIVRLPVNEL